MGIDFLLPDEIAPFLEKRLKEGWVILCGDSDAITKVEYNVYTPGTPDNTDFEGIFHPTMNIFLGRKTKKLYNFLGHIPDWKLTLGLEFFPGKGTNILAHQVLAKPGRNDAIKQFIKQLLGEKEV